MPCVIIPTFWTRRRARASNDLLTAYNHPTFIDGESTLPECLASLEKVRGLDSVIVLCAATDPSIEHEAEDRVRDILSEFPGVEAMVFGPAELGSLHRRLEQLEFADMIQGVSLTGYGAVRNVGLIVAGVLGKQSVLFVDDDQVVVDVDFLDCAREGLGERIGDKVVYAKTGYYVDGEGHYQRHSEPHWTDMFWRQADAYNQALAIVDAPPRLRPTPIAFGGCLVLHRNLYCNVSFDPWIVRGEDTDYVINVRMHGGDVFLDGEWKVIHQPPSVRSQAFSFRQDVYRFIYEHRKLEFAKSQVDLRQVTPESLSPYPGEFIGSSVTWRSVATALLRAVSGRGESGSYLRVAHTDVRHASSYAEAHCDQYFHFQRRWPLLMDRVWEDVALKSLFMGERRVDRSAITGRFPVIKE